MKRIGVITSGGDVPGLNTCIRAVTRAAIDIGAEVIGVEDGYAGLIRGQFRKLDLRSVSGIMRRGGTFLGTARSKEFETESGRHACVKQLNDAGVEGLVVIGGNGSLAGAMKLYDMGVPLIGVPKTIDNDQHGTDFAIGVDTALNTIAEAVGRVKDTASSHHRAFLIETMGRNCGYLALASSIITGAEMALIPEYPTSPLEVVTAIEESYRIGKQHCIIMIAEGWQPGTRALQSFLSWRNNNSEGFDVREVVLGHIQRGGTPTAFDRMLATRLGVFAAERLLNGDGIGMMAGIRGDQLGMISLKEATTTEKLIDQDLLRIAKILAK